jgi:hypothetical protein
MAGSTPIYGIPYPEATDLVADYPALGASLANTLDDKLPTLSASAPSAPSVGQVWFDTSSGTPAGNVWDGSAWQGFSSGLSGYGGWATISAMTGSPTRYDYTADGVAWSALEWTGAGTVTVTDGLVDCLIVGGGGGSYPALGALAGVGGYVVFGLHMIPAGALAVTVGAGGASGNSGEWESGASSIGSLSTGVAGVGRGTAGDDIINNTQQNPFTSSITGSSLAVSGTKNYLSSVYGGGAATTNDTGASGVVIIRVPAANITATSGWV